MRIGLRAALLVHPTLTAARAGREAAKDKFPMPTGAVGARMRDPEWAHACDVREKASARPRCSATALEVPDGDGRSRSGKREREEDKR